MASIGWIDFSPAHRARVGTILELLKPEGMVDELGVGIIRDAIADQLFPGISTIQTRAKYFFIIPYILSEYQQIKPMLRSREKPDKYLERREYEVMWKLGEVYNHIEGHGVIGISKRKPQKIMRRPSEIYWNGIAKFNLIDNKGLGMQTYFNNHKKSVLDSLLSIPQGDDAPIDDLDAEYDNFYGIKVPYDREWYDNLSLQLTTEEAEIFRDKILSKVKGSALCELLENASLYDEFKSATRFKEFTLRAILLEIPDILKKKIILAHDFSELMFGAHIVYNCLLQKAKFGTSHFESEWDEWSKGIEGNMIDFNGFSPADIFNIAHTLRPYAKQFILDWWKFVNTDLNNISFRNQLVENQEFHNKRGKARLRLKKHDDIRENKWIGLKYLDYRYLNVKTILNDITSSIEE
jgi:hypothetical protein